MRQTHVAFLNLFVLVCVLTASGCAARKTQKNTFKLPNKFENVLIARAQQGDGYGPCEPTIAINPTNTSNIAAGAILDRYYWSEDGGKTWQSQLLTSPYGVFGDPVIVADAQGNFYYAHLSDPEDKGWSSPKLLDRIVIQKSTDGGKTYSEGSFCGLRPPKDQDKQWLITDPKTHAVYCTWTEFDVYGSIDKEKDKSRILFSKSIDGGLTWTETLAINQFEGDCEDDDFTTEGAVPAIGPNGEVYVCWAWNDKLWFDRSLDGGKTWLKEDIVVAKQPGGWTFDIPGLTRCNGMPVLVCDLSNGPNRGTLYVNWTDQSNGVHDTDVWIAKSTDGGKTWSKPKRINDDGKGHHQFLTWLCVDQTTGFLYTVFYDRRGYQDESTDVYLAVSRDGGASFVNQKISNSPFDPSKLVFFGDYNHISAHNGVVRPIWTQLSKGTLSVWTAIIDLK